MWLLCSHLLVLLHRRTIGYENVGKGEGVGRTSGSSSFVCFNTFNNSNPISDYHIKISYSLFFFMAQQSLVGQGLLIIEASRSHSDTPHSVGRLWTSDQPDAETSTWQHTTLTTDRHPSPCGIWTRNPSKRAAADQRLRLRGHWDRHLFTLLPT
jgi:hypothetical protein